MVLNAGQKGEPCQHNKHPSTSYPTHTDILRNRSIPTDITIRCCHIKLALVSNHATVNELVDIYIVHCIGELRYAIADTVSWRGEKI